MHVLDFFLLLQMNFDSCLKRETKYPCSIFSDRHPSTVAMTVLVVVEMFNALNNLSENQSLMWVFIIIHRCLNTPLLYSLKYFLRVEVGGFALVNNIRLMVIFSVIPPWSNLWLVGSIGVTMLLHCLILYVQPLSVLFSVSFYSPLILL